MQWEGEMCIVSGNNRAVDGKPPRTVVELWCRSRAGHSVTLLVDGLRPYMVLAQPGRPRPASEAESGLDFLRGMDEVVEITSTGDKWTRLGEKPHWRVEVNQPYEVPRLRKRIQDSWEVTSADILFVQRLLLDLDLGPHIRASGEVLWTGDRAPNDAKTADSTDPDMAESRIKDAGGSGIYPVDMILSCNISGLERTEPFPDPSSRSPSTSRPVSRTTGSCARQRLWTGPASAQSTR